MTGEALKPFVFTYRNWRGEIGERRAIPIRVWFGSTEWHPEPQWLLNADDLDKGETRDFAMKDIAASPPAPAEAGVEPVAYRFKIIAAGWADTSGEGWSWSHGPWPCLQSDKAEPLYTAEALSAARAQARREALELAKSIAQEAYDECEKAVGPCSETGAYECDLERSGRDCLCMHGFDLADKLESRLRALSDAAPAEEG